MNVTVITGQEVDRSDRRSMCLTEQSSLFRNQLLKERNANVPPPGSRVGISEGAYAI